MCILGENLEKSINFDKSIYLLRETHVNTLTNPTIWATGARCDWLSDKARPCLKCTLELGSDKNWDFRKTVGFQNKIRIIHFFGFLYALLRRGSKAWLKFVEDWGNGGKGVPDMVLKTLYCLTLPLLTNRLCTLWCPSSQSSRMHFLCETSYFFWESRPKSYTARQSIIFWQMDRWRQAV